MTFANLESRKSSLMAQLAVLQDESVISQIENLLSPKGDWADELSDAQKKTINKGIAQLDNGEHVLYSDFIRKYKAAR